MRDFNEQFKLWKRLVGEQILVLQLVGVPATGACHCWLPARLPAPQQLAGVILSLRPLLAPGRLIPCPCLPAISCRTVCGAWPLWCTV